MIVSLCPRSVAIKLAYVPKIALNAASRRTGSTEVCWVASADLKASTAVPRKSCPRLTTLRKMLTSSVLFRSRTSFGISRLPSWLCETFLGSIMLYAL